MAHNRRYSLTDRIEWPLYLGLLIAYACTTGLILSFF